ncbi:hypothetical protein [Escherichia coli]|uniref:Uncharacterized protein n=1 Tax=Escherichia coli TaxID=562 RepID=A0A2A2CD28_ECOLX|nr:hypothetical protein [Escherichia coli]PAU25760.1 hypothetical protein BTQ06_04540 [Escherichia coli]HAP0005726.1 hypothetical protein [Escherichia coli]HCK1111179.1 hypothetical protein [Escherichia coli]HCP7375033.1 hypothetical protein [Escherichia coli]HCP8818215.1 hypothetical protein [Escherichia coli]
MATRKDDLPEFPEEVVMKSGLAEHVEVLRKAHALCNECKARGVAVLLVMETPKSDDTRMVMAMGHDVHTSPVLRECKASVDHTLQLGNKVPVDGDERVH